MREGRKPETHSDLDFLMRGIYSYKDVRHPLWHMQALLKWAGNFLTSTVEAKFPTNWDRMSPKCCEAFPKYKSIVNLEGKNEADASYRYGTLTLIVTSFANSVGRISTAEHIMPSPSIS